MKKLLLLAGVACVLSYSQANALEYTPYVSGKLAYSRMKMTLKSEAMTLMKFIRKSLTSKIGTMAFRLPPVLNFRCATAMQSGRNWNTAIVTEPEKPRNILTRATLPQTK